MKLRTLTLTVFMLFVCAFGVPMVSTQAFAQVGPNLFERKLPAGGKVTLKLHAGDVVVSGWDGDSIQVKADDDDGKPLVNILDDSSRAGSLVITTQSPAGKWRKEGIDISVKMPRNAELEIDLRNGDLHIEDISGAVTVRNGGGDLSVSRVGNLNVASGGGDMSVSNVTGTATLRLGGGDLSVNNVSGAVSVANGGGDVSVHQIGEFDIKLGGGDLSAKEIRGNVSLDTGGGDASLGKVSGNVTVQGGSGDMSIHDIDGNVRLMRANGDLSLKNIAGNISIQMISGDVSVNGARGQIEITNANGDVSLHEISGGVIDVTTTSGSLYVKTDIQPGGKYRLKSTSGDVVLWIQPNPPGFSANLSSYSGSMETDFQLDNATSTNRNIRGKFGDGAAQITLDSFNGEVNLRKMGNEPKSNKKKHQEQE